MTYSVISQTPLAGAWQQSANGHAHPIQLHGCQACGAVVYDPYSHTDWHESLEGKR